MKLAKLVQTSLWSLERTIWRSDEITYRITEYTRVSKPSSILNIYKICKKSHVSIIPVIHVYMRYVYSHSFLCDTYIITYFISLLATVLWFPSNIEKVSGRNTLNSDPNISLVKTAGWDYLGFMALNCDRCELLPVGPSSVCCVGLTVWHITGSGSHHPTTVPHLNNNRKKILFKKWIRPSET